MNLNAYGYGPEHDRRWIIIDVGVTFGGDDTPGIDLITPDPTFLEDQGDKIDAIFLTHAHEDHIGAIGLILPRLKTRAPIYATPFTAHLAQAKLIERGQKSVSIDVLPLGAEVQAGQFKVRYITLTHSIPEPNALSLETPLGTILHTGDWKIDPDPLLGESTDIDSLTALGDQGVLAMVCDSTNVFVEGESGSEGVVRENLIENFSHEALALYLFLITVGDSDGVSWYSDNSICRKLNCSVEILREMRRELTDGELLAYRKPHYQVLELPRPHLEDNFRKVLKAAAENIGTRRRQPAGTEGMGVSLHPPGGIYRRDESVCDALPASVIINALTGEVK